jgi:hypothetical protein
METIMARTTRNLSNALEDIVARIERGQEYPDAQWAASQTHGVSGDALQEAYDEYCYDSQSRANPEESLAYAYA